MFRQIRNFRERGDWKGMRSDACFREGGQEEDERIFI